ncbi:MAG TPA: glucose-6-phosphate dehydrogenase assembly protein OpcA [Candidatus Acidoferrales bacterium]|nr:glucose-6-phosphate dehydrogenase assembly protein OpcA [Candidatus Acidoferrales bacterium]
MSGPVSVTHLDGILAELQRARVALSSGEIGIAPSVATLNFIVFIDDPARRDWVRERALLVAEKHPSRLILLDACDASGGANVRISARQTTGSTVVSERVELAVGGLDAEALTSLTQELSVHDIPTVLWWTATKLLESRRFCALIAQANHFLVDSSGADRDEAVLRELAQFLQRYDGISLHDLAWMRLAPWQDMIAQFFDEPALSDELRAITSLEIASGSAAEALYLAGWLASALSWRAESPYSFRTNIGRHVTFTRAHEGERRRVVRVTLATDVSRFVAELSADDHVVGLSVEGPKARAPWFVPLQNVENTTLIERAILAGATDEIFKTALQATRDLLT